MKAIIAIVIIILSFNCDRWLAFCNSTGQAHFGIIIIIHSELKGHEKEICINHELIHIKQQRDYYIIGFYIIYIYDYLKNIIKYKDPKKAYEQIRFEIEAKKNEKNFDYWKKCLIFRHNVLYYN